MAVEVIPTLNICNTLDGCCIFVEDYGDQIKLMITTGIGTESEHTHELKFDLIQDTQFTKLEELMQYLSTKTAIEIINLYYSDEIEEA